MQAYHTIIIGAGPGGLSCAATLAKVGRKVLVLERKKIVGPKVCAGGVPYHALQHLNLPHNLFALSFPTQHIFTPRQHTTITSSLPIISTVDRKQLGQFMAARATLAGATIITNTHVKKITKNTVETKETTYSFQNLVGADGSNSMVRRFLNIPSTSMGVGIHYHVPGNFPQMEWHFDPKIFASGYAWIFPHKKSASIGAYVRQHEIPGKQIKKRLIHWAAARGISFNNCQPMAALINFDFRGWHFNNFFLVGDAAGLASGITGEGILPATISGVAVAKKIMDPQYKDSAMLQLIIKHRHHKNMQKILAMNKVICHLALEMLALGLRTKLIPFRFLEMG